jgi:FkbM family methyltransferase
MSKSKPLIAKKLIELYFFFLEKTFYTKGKKQKISNYEIRLPIRVSHLYSNNYETNNISYLSLLVENNWNVLDLGANVGVYTVILSRLVGENGCVVSFEPTKSIFKHLKNSIKWNNVRNVRLENKAVGKTEMEMMFYFKLESGSVSNSLISYKENEGKSYKVDVVSLDNYKKTNDLKFDFIKLDVEGSEIDVLKGASSVIKNDRPILLIAVHPLIIQENKQNHSEIFEILESFNYSIYYNGNLISKEYFNVKMNLFDVICIPKESSKNSIFQIK